MKTIKFPCIHYLFIFLFAILLAGCKDSTEKKDTSKTEISFSEEELFRPNFHFTPQKAWMNDPNGMFYLNGKYHLYFQYYPDDNVWGPMHWGHAISEDLISWKEQPIAIYPDSLGYIFSGSAVVDHKNTSGFGKDGIVPVVAIFTYHDIIKEKKGDIDFQSQAIAYSLDEGMTWTKYAGNPVIPNTGIKDFRDPKVIWNEAQKRWILVLATYGETFFYGSKDLKSWNYLSSFGEGVGEHGGVWECPDFFPIKAENSDEVKWVLLQSLNPGHVNGGSGTQYFVGDFKNNEFVLDEGFAQDLAEQKVIWLDHGRDNYAGVTWSNIPESDGRKLFMGWMSNWDYALVVPTTKWRSSMTLARELKLKKVNNSFRVESTPVKEFDEYKEVVLDSTNFKLKGQQILYSDANAILNNSVIEINLSNLGSSDFSFSLSNESGDRLEFGINAKEAFYYLNRTKAGDISFSEKFAPHISKAPFTATSNSLSMEVVIDKTSIELFYNKGETVMTEIFFPKAPFETLEIHADKDSGVMVELLKISKIVKKH
jgi:levanase/fructan beta-fructosidase